MAVPMDDDLFHTRPFHSRGPPKNHESEDGDSRSSRRPVSKVSLLGYPRVSPGDPVKTLHGFCNPLLCSVLFETTWFLRVVYHALCCEQLWWRYHFDGIESAPHPRSWIEISKLLDKVLRIPHSRVTYPHRSRFNFQPPPVLASSFRPSELRMIEWIHYSFVRPFLRRFLDIAPSRIPGFINNRQSRPGPSVNGLEQARVQRALWDLLTDFKHFTGSTRVSAADSDILSPRITCGYLDLLYRENVFSLIGRNVRNRSFASKRTRTTFSKRTQLLQWCSQQGYCRTNSGRCRHPLSLSSLGKSI
ncbi:hypothetical protein BJ508DRAFT_313310 [Ascobolus immersus RN42]|uniref:Uncharacterized protein n=1 Tax=Ascobolus immersus RN42 TaxID=1160509 RepID=A0A3N4HL29_ASCIM|nr:hypothetical protein BJ508DRAFT_313310 [Ascobolus immersus RN42]